MKLPVTQIKDSDWGVSFTNQEGDTAENFVVQRENGKNFHVTMIDDSVPLPNGEVAKFRQPMIFEHDQGAGKVGDIVIVLRLNPSTQRYCVQTEEENVFVTETDIIKIARADRSSVDRIEQAVKRSVVVTGKVYSNPRRIGGMSIVTNYVIAGWSPQNVDEMIDIYEYVQGLDSMGLATLLKALQHMPAEPAFTIFEQMRTPNPHEDEK